MAPKAHDQGLEGLLVESGAVSAEQLERARRIARHLHRNMRPVDVLIENGQLSRSEYERAARQHRSTMSLAEILVEDGVLGDEGFAAYETAREAAPHAGDRALLVASGLVAEAHFLRALASRHDLPFVEPDVSLVDLNLLARASWPYLVHHLVLPLRIVDGALDAILADPLDQQILGELERMFEVPVRPCCASEGAIRTALRALEVLRSGGAAPTASELQYVEIRDAENATGDGEGAVGLVDHLLQRAIQLRASDLHIEPQEKRVRVRVRIDGVLEPLTDLPAAFAPQVTSRIKLLSGADIAERRMHQDGRISVRVQGREVDIRVSSYVSAWGETLVLRLLDRRRGLVPLDELGFEPRVLELLRDVALRASSGMFLVTGPTGSGKTTTLYSFMDFLNDPAVKIITCEDPMEYVLDGCIQGMVNSRSKPTFGDALRAIVRQDPDIIVVGEIRDHETAELAVEAALTGHQVLSTLHTEDSVGTSVRLVDMGIEPYLVSSTLTAALAQRLVRRICSHCSEPTTPTREDLRFLGLERADLAGLEWLKGRGCPACSGSGYHGRIGLYELLLPDDDFRDALLRRAPSREMRQLARRTPAYFSLQEAGLLNAAAGRTTLTEIATNVPRDPGARKPIQLMELAAERRAA